MADDPRETVLAGIGLTKRFGAVTAIERLDYAVRRGEVLALLGANGAGKTTAMNMALGLVTPTEGSIRVFGMELERHRIEILRRCNFCSAYTALPGNLLVRQNLDVFARLYRVPNRKAKIAELLERLEITGLRDRVTAHLSAGESTRLNLCKALLNDPELLLLDEPTASLDPDIADKVRQSIRTIQRERGISILYTSHNMRDIEEVADRILFLHRGKVVAEGSPEQIKTQFQSRNLEEVFIHIARDGEVVGT
jgi:ABC-2 type transport system ATP-binding protein